MVLASKLSLSCARLLAG